MYVCSVRLWRVSFVPRVCGSLLKRLLCAPIYAHRIRSHYFSFLCLLYYLGKVMVVEPMDVCTEG